MPDLSPFRLIGVTLTNATEVRLDARARARTRSRDLRSVGGQQFFRPVGSPGGPYHLVLGVEDKRLIFEVRLADGQPHGTVILSRTSFRRIIKDYYKSATAILRPFRTSLRRRIEALDMGRRGLHNEGAELLHERLKGKIEMDFDTARGCFTLICVLHLKG